MIVRIWRGWTTPADASGYVEHLRDATLPALRPLAGFEGAEILRRDAGIEVEFVIRPARRSLDDVTAFAGETVGHYEVVPGS